MNRGLLHRPPLQSAPRTLVMGDMLDTQHSLLWCSKESWGVKPQKSIQTFLRMPCGSPMLWCFARSGAPTIRKLRLTRKDNSLRVPQKEVGKGSLIILFSFGHYLVTFSDTSVTLFVTFLPDSFCRNPFAALACPALQASWLLEGTPSGYRLIPRRLSLIQGIARWCKLANSCRQTLIELVNAHKHKTCANPTWLAPICLPRTLCNDAGLSLYQLFPIRLSSNLSTCPAIYLALKLFIVVFLYLPHCRPPSLTHSPPISVPQSPSFTPSAQQVQH